VVEDPREQLRDELEPSAYMQAMQALGLKAIIDL
jgi:hypothetical protein